MVKITQEFIQGANYELTVREQDDDCNLIEKTFIAEYRGYGEEYGWHIFMEEGDMGRDYYYSDILKAKLIK